MKSIYTALLLVFALPGFTQTVPNCGYRAEYTVDVIADTTEIKFYRDWRYLLLNRGEISRFYEKNAHFNDSMRVANFTFPSDQADPAEKQRALNEFMAASNNWKKKTFLGYKVEKNLTRDWVKVNSFSLLPPTHLEVTPSRFAWQLTGRGDTLLGLPVREARLAYGGRNWTAWYAPALPVPDGPYVFSGLPGLIVRVQDDRGWYTFQLVDFQVSSPACHWGEYFIHNQSQAISRRQYARIASEAKDNPKLPGARNISEELILQVRENAAWKYFMLLERPE